MSGIETELQLLRTVQVTLGSDGSGLSVPIGPDQSWERWVIENISTSCDSTANTTLIILRQGTLRPVEGTYSGNLDSTDTPYKLMPGERLSFQYTGGDTGATGLITITGTKYLKGRRAY